VGGSAREVSYLRNLARQLGVKDYCILPGTVDYDEVVYWINAFDIGVGLDKAERLVKIGSSNQKIRQYLACGVPVIAGTGTSPFIHENRIGRLVHPDDMNEFILATKELLSIDSGQKKTIARKARSICEQKFSTDRINQMRLQIWKKAIRFDK
jgi:glycosyltransferase involved in cell wall biosynthesis